MSGERDYWIDRGDGAAPASLEQWARWQSEDPETSGKRVAYTVVAGIRVSTVCLGMNHNFARQGPPILYETMVFPIEDSEDYGCWRYATREKAEAGHARVTAWVEAVEAWTKAGCPGERPEIPD